MVGAGLTSTLIQQLYDIERAAADRSADGRRAVRRERSIPPLRPMEAERHRLARTVLPKSLVADALRYLTNQWASRRSIRSFSAANWSVSRPSRI